MKVKPLKLCKAPKEQLNRCTLNIGTNSPANQYLEAACQSFTVVKRTIHQYGDFSLGTYINRFTPSDHSKAYQSRDDLYQIIKQYCHSFTDARVAKLLVHDLATNPVVLTANHQGTDYFAQSVQGTLIFALNRLLSPQSPTVPVFAFGNVPLNNLTFPRGMLLYRVNQSQLKKMPLKAPLFPDRLKRRMVSHTPKFDQAMVLRLKKRLKQMVLKNQVASDSGSIAAEILDNDYCNPAVMRLPDYSHQATALNNRIWKQLFRNKKPSADLIYLEIEKIVSQLLIRDLADTQSLAYQVMFEQELREHTLEALNRVTGCWNYETLCRRAYPHFTNEDQKYSNHNAGTVFFWGIDSSGRRIPLALIKSNASTAILRGISDHGKQFETPFTCQSLLEGLQQRKLLPSLFTCFLTIAFARGVVCVGGYHQGEYLPLIKQGLVAALHQTKGYHDVAHLIENVSAGSYLSGMMAVMSKIAMEDGLAPAGPVEIIAGGGITHDEIEQMRALTVREAHIAGLFETVPDIIRPALLETDWKLKLAQDCYQQLKNKVIIK
ncbi:hypothetical protein QUF90_07175 [Desulfococcaceae bacterium HSG9]|nr:hypothetical protein [Desulfococcaceae bacterium HSG9]